MTLMMFGDQQFAALGGEAGRLIRERDWAETPLGAIGGWPQSLKTLVGLMLTSSQPMFVSWGPTGILLYNDAYAEILGGKHPAIGSVFLEVWHEIRDDLVPIVEEAYAGRPVHMHDIELWIERKGYPEETHFAFSYTPVRDESGAVVGFFCPCLETTDQVLAERRRDALAQLDIAIRDLVIPAQIARTSAQILAESLGACRVGYGEVDADDRTIALLGSWSGSVAPLIAKLYDFSDFGTYVDDLFTGASVAVTDVRLDDRTRANAARFEELGIRAHLDVPILEGGRIVADVFAHSDTVRHWSDHDVSLVRDFALRTRAAITRRTAEALLRESETRIRAVQEASIDGFMLLDSVRNPGGEIVDFRWAHVNDAAARIVGRPLEWFRGRRMLEEMPGNRQYGLFDAYVRVVETGEPWTSEFAYAGDDVHVYLRLVAAKAGDGFAVSFADLSERRRAEVALQESEERFRNIADNAPMTIWVTDENGHCTYLNRQWYQFTGQTPEEALGLGWLDATHPDDRDKAERMFLEATAEVRPFRLEYRLRRFDGTYRWAIDGASPRFDLQGRFAGFVGSVVDIDERREMEEKLRELNETLEERVAERSRALEAAHDQLRQSQKLESMGQLTGGVAHDFNNLLTPIVAVLDRMQRANLGTERDQRLIGAAAQSADRARILVQRLLAFARRQPLQATSTDLGPLIRGMGDLIASTTGPNIEVVVDVEERLPFAKVDANQLEMAILNLAVNARDAMPEGGELRISLKPAIVHAGDAKDVAAGQYLRLTVSDTGTGMEEAVLARAIEPFFSTKGLGQGTGLGLSMVHGLASQLGGTLMIESVVGEGTSVNLLLPQSDDRPPLAEEPAPGSPNGRSRGTVLLVDDEPLIRLSTAAMLAELGYSVAEAASSAEALALLDQGLRPDLLMTDHLMPGMSGTDLATKVETDWPGVRILIVSGYAEIDGIAPKFPRLTKPFRSQDLVERLEALMA